MSTEIRALRSIEQRAVTDEEKAAGYIGALRGSIPYNKDSYPLTKRGRKKRFIERIAPGAFDESVKQDGSEIMVMAGHTDDPLMGLARNGKNLIISSDERGMNWEALVPETRAGKDLLRLVELGIINGTSFEFDVENSSDEEWSMRDARMDGRMIKKAKLRALNPVTWPAYADSSLMVEMRRRDDGRMEFEKPAQDDSATIDAQAAEQRSENAEPLFTDSDRDRRLRILHLGSQ